MVAAIVVATVLASNCLWRDNPNKDRRHTDYLKQREENG